VIGNDFNMDDVHSDLPRPGAGKLEMPHAIGRATTLVMAIACGVAAASVYCNQPMLGISEAAFPGQASVAGLVPMATQLGFAVGLLLLVPLGDCVERRRLGSLGLANPWRVRTLRSDGPGLVDRVVENRGERHADRLHIPAAAATSSSLAG